MSAPIEIRAESIYLIGFSGSGKSTIGPPLAKRLHAKFYDTDAMIERAEKTTIIAIFENRGERYFRQCEQRVIETLIQKKGRKVVALGGGAFANRGNRQLIATDGLSIYLSCSVVELHRRLCDLTDRPLLKSISGTRVERLQKIKSLLERRKSSYQLADIRVATTDKSINEIIRMIEFAIRTR